MSPESQRITIAEESEWERVFHDDGTVTWINPYGAKRPRCPDYINSLDDMHEAELMLTHDDYQLYCKRLIPMLAKGQTIATSEQRAEAFLKTLNLWTES